MRKTLTFTRDGLREVDRRAVEEYHIPILVLMENAGRAAAEVLLGRAKAGGQVLVLAGPGNNGGDGLVLARHVHNAGMGVTVLLLAERAKYRDATGAQLAIVDAMKLPVEVMSAGHVELRDWLVETSPEDWIVDAIFGTGLSRKVEGPAAEAIGAVNASGRAVLAVDIPSGLDCDTGEAVGGGEVIRAKVTVSFCGVKNGFGRGKGWTGSVVVGEIGVPVELLRGVADGGG